MTFGVPANLDFRHLIEASPEVTVVLTADPTFTILAASDAYLEVTGKAREELIGHALFDVFPAHPEHPSTTAIGEVRSALKEAVDSQSVISTGPFRYDLERPAAEGGGYAERYWTHRNVPICDDSGQTVYVIHRVEEVTAFIMQERQRGQGGDDANTPAIIEEIRRSMEQRTRHQFREMFMKAPAFICMLEGPSHVFMMANPAYYELSGHRKLIGRTVREVFPEHEIQKFIEMLDSVYQTGTPQFFTEQEIVLRPADSDTEKRYATFAYLPTYDMHGKIDGVACFGFEVTELVEARKKVEQQAELAERENKQKDEFLAMLGHELRNPLAPIAIAVDVLQSADEGVDHDRLVWAGDLIHRQLDQLVRLVDDLLDVARINQGRIELKKQRSTLDEIISRALDACVPLIEQKEQHFEVHRPEAMIEVEVDVARMAQVVANLLNNATKYTQKGGHITLDVRHEGEVLILEVSDDGQGIEPELLSDIFDLFTQAETSLDRSQGGLGLGLTLVRRLVEMHEGDVQAFSDGPGCGACFRVELPVVIEQAPRVHSSSHQAIASPRRHRVLIVDDNRDAADILALLLSVEGNEVEIAYDGKAALELAETFEPQLIFLDIGLPEMDGYQVAQRLRANPRFEKTTIVAVTGYGQKNDRERAFASGFDHHLVKPANRDDIRGVINAL